MLVGQFKLDLIVQQGNTKETDDRYVKCGEEWTAWEPPCMRDGLPLILNIHDCGCYGRIP